VLLALIIACEQHFSVVTTALMYFSAGRLLAWVAARPARR
jgi:hypothetical protein